MLKATLRSAVLLGLLAWSLPSFAEVQNVKVGGDITVRAFHRESQDLNDGDDVVFPGTNAFGDDEDDFLMSTVGVNIGADLTENVGAFIRLANERDWNVSTNAQGDFDLSQAYITLKELFYSPLTLRVGQQPIVWGRGLVLGSNLLPGVILGGNDRNASISANEFTDFTAFDAIRATLDLSGVAGVGMPLTLDTVYIKGDENNSGQSDDRNIFGVNLGTRFDSMSSELETYYLNLRTKDTATIANTVDAQYGNRDGSVNTIGVRGSARPGEGTSVYGELAYQFGKRPADLETIIPAGDAQQAWLANLGADYTLSGDMSPKIGAEWRFTSGKDVDAAVTGWAPIAPGYFTTALREFQTRSTMSVNGFYPNSQAGVTSGQTNQHELALYGSLVPIEDLAVNQRLSWFFTPVGTLAATSPAAVGNPKRERYLGLEWDTVLNYSYTDDVQLGLIYGVFFPGNVFRTTAHGTANADNVAQELITSVSVKF